ELHAAGFTQGIIKGFGIRLGTTAGTLQRNNIEIYIGETTLEEFPNEKFISMDRLQKVKDEVDKTLEVNEINMFTLDNTFIWDGVSNIVVQVVYSDADNGSPLATSSVLTGFNSPKINRALYSGSSTIDNLDDMN